MYREGRGVPQDYAAATEWFRKAAEQGLDTAQFNLAQRYGDGMGAPRDLKVAADWYRRAANQGMAEAQNSLGVMYAAGDGVPRDPVEAYKWFELSARSGGEGASDNRKRVAAGMTPDQISDARDKADRWSPQ
jgi:TPR repeat protein